MPPKLHMARRHFFCPDSDENGGIGTEGVNMVKWIYAKAKTADASK